MKVYLWSSQSEIAMYFVHFVVFQALYLSIWTDLFITCRYQAVVLKIYYLALHVCCSPIFLNLFHVSQTQVSNDPKQRAKGKVKDSIPQPRKDYDWLDTSVWRNPIGSLSLNRLMDTTCSELLTPWVSLSHVISLLSKWVYSVKIFHELFIILYKVFWTFTFVA